MSDTGELKTLDNIKSLFQVGDMIKFDDHGIQRIGRVETVGMYGYWIVDRTGCVGTGYVRCDFDKAILIIG